MVAAQWAWVGIAGVVAPVVAATVVLTGVLATIRQKERTDRKDQWWKRVQWSADLVLKPDDRHKALGMAALTALIEHADDIQDGDADLLAAIIGQVDISNQQPSSREVGHAERATPADGGSDPRGPRPGGTRPEDTQDVA